jgi:cell division protein FtsN
VQLAALASREQAEAQWKLLQRQMPELLAGRTPAIAEARINGRTWWRVRAGSFADAAAASSFCGRIRAKGAACSVARF